MTNHLSRLEQVFVGVDERVGSKLNQRHGMFSAARRTFDNIGYEETSGSCRSRVAACQRVV
jgi:hypothetical protein